MAGLRQLRTSGVSQLYQQAQDSPDTALGGVYGGVRTNCCIQHRKVWTILVLIQLLVAHTALCTVILIQMWDINSFIRNQNIYGNRHTQSRDIAETVPSILTSNMQFFIIHEYGSTCTFHITLSSKNIERESIDPWKLTFVHDYTAILVLLKCILYGSVDIFIP